MMSLGPLMISLRGTALAADEREWLREPSICGVILFSRNFESREQLEELTADIHALRSPSLLIAVDQEGGRVQRFREPFFELPPMRQIGHRFDEDRSAGLDAARQFAWLMAAELRSVGVDLSFAPVVDLDLGLAEVIGDRSLHSDAEAVSDLALAFMAGAKDAGMAITAKHFPSHAGARSDSHLEAAADRREFEALIDDLLPYERLIAHGLHAVMVAHVAFPALDPKPASFSGWWIGEYLRRELAFSGVVISDDIDMQGAAAFGDHASRAKSSLAAGADMVLLCNRPDAVPAVLAALEGYSNPAAQLRLMRLRGSGSQLSWDALRDSERWRHAHDVVASLRDAPALELEG